MQEVQQFDQLVVIGSSAGGVEALSTLAATLPAGFPAPIVLAQHLDPRRPSHLASILARVSPLPVRIVEDRARLEPAAIYVVPADRHIEIDDGSVHLSSDSADRHKPSVDRLFRSAAEVYGDRLIAVVLTGQDSDGAAGAQAVKTAGGTVIIQNPATARFPSMPASLSPAVVDIVADLEQIGPLLHDLVTGVYLPSQPDDDRQLRAFLTQVREQSGVDFTSYKMPTIRRRLQRRMAAVQVQHLADYVRYVQRHPEEYQRLVNSFLIKVTEFFRDPELFAFLREQVLPELIAEARRRGHELRLWSAGCATGQEAYSIAILVAEALGDELDRFNVRIFATDLDAEAIDVARRGSYPAAALENVSPELLERYFIQVDGRYEINKQLRALTVFGQHDLGQRAPFPRIDLCVCRNVLIYFTAELQTRALQIFAFSLRDGGVLVLGKSETITPIADYFRPLQPQLKVFRRQGERLLIPSARLTAAAPPPVARAAGYRRGSANLDARRMPSAVPTRTSRDGLARCLLELPVGVAVVDRRYDIQLLNGAASNLLGLQGAAIGEDLIHLTRAVPASDLRAAIDAAFSDHASQSAEAVPRDSTPTDLVLEVQTASGERRYVRVACYPHAAEASGGEDQLQDGELVMVVVIDVTQAETERRAHVDGGARDRQLYEQTLAQTRREHEVALRQTERNLAEANERLQRLTEANRDLLVANQRLITTNIELRSANEEATVSTEEAQAATEEVETLNEELQASNEELETLNEEMQATVEELKTTNDELQARTAELQEQAATLETERRLSDAERARLSAILNSIGDAVLVVDAGGAIILTNPAYQGLVGSGELERADDAEGHPVLALTMLRERAARGESFNVEFTIGRQDDDRRWLEASGEPVRMDGAARWGVVVIRDISERSLRRLQEEFVANVSHGLQTPITVLRAGLGLVAEGAAPRLHQEEIELIDAARQQVEQLRVQVEDLLAANQLRAGGIQLERAPADLRGIVTDVVDSLRVLFDEKGQLLTLDLPEPLPALVDARRLEQVLINLLVNAGRHTPPGTHVTVSGARAGDEVQLTVRDDGPGIPAESLETVFQPFMRLSNRGRGSGLGLNIARSLVALHGGRLWAERPADGGVAFIMALPLYDEGRPS